jgi:hypothetical protein
MKGTKRGARRVNRKRRMNTKRKGISDKKKWGDNDNHPKETFSEKIILPHHPSHPETSPIICPHNLEYERLRGGGVVVWFFTPNILIENIIVLNFLFYLSLSPLIFFSHYFPSSLSVYLLSSEYFGSYEYNEKR